MPRLAMCHVCLSLTRLPDPPVHAPLVPARIAWVEDGKEVEHTFRDEVGAPAMVPKYDPALEDWVSRHAHDDIHIPDYAKWDVAAIDRLAWDSSELMSEISRELERERGAHYHLQEELRTEALRCFGDHHRPKDSCSDVYSDAKLIGDHNANLHPDERMYLCHLCPFVHGYVVPKIRHAKGYDR